MPRNYRTPKRPTPASRDLGTAIVSLINECRMSTAYLPMRQSDFDAAVGHLKAAVAILSKQTREYRTYQPTPKVGR